eukprot:TRINITY_DN2600_c0_g1_i2.p1 TRINITY_DN2600_c0_g1~~TRINITY_DN2600_c0_g1_i2.p1  ORF type:complete len:222 (+),score=47.29 TRINITY_DN2600_c0_g1_i2:136-801(+)
MEQYFLFWIETQNYKYLNSEDLLSDYSTRIKDTYLNEENLKIKFDKYIVNISGSVPNLRTSYMVAQNEVWKVLEYDCFPGFKTEYGKNMSKPLSKQAMTDLELTDPTFISVTTEMFQNHQNCFVGSFNPSELPNDRYNEHQYIVVPNYEEIWIDPDLMLAFREFLYSVHSSENLSSYLQFKLYQDIEDEEEREQKAIELYEKYIDPSSELQLNFDHTTTMV